MDDTPASANATVCEGPSWNPSKVAVRVVTAPVYGESYSSVSCSRSDAHAQDELMSGGDMFKVLIEEDKISREDPGHWYSCQSYFNNSSRSSTDFSSFISIVVREGNWAVGVLCAVTRAGKPSPSITASTIPAVKDEQLN